MYYKYPLQCNHVEGHLTDMFTVEDEEVEEGEEVEEDVESLLSLEQSNGGDHLLLGELVNHPLIDKLAGNNVSQSSFTQDETGSEETLIGGLNDLQSLSLTDGGGGGGGSEGNTGNLLDF